MQVSKVPKYGIFRVSAIGIVAVAWVDTSCFGTSILRLGRLSQDPSGLALVLAWFGVPYTGMVGWLRLCTVLNTRTL